jgi:hypothetical protein
MRRVLTGGLTALVPVLVLAGCGAADTGWQGTVRDSAGVSIVSNTGGAIWAPGEEWTVEEALRIGMADGEAAYQFGEIVGIDVDADGRIYVLDQQAHEVRVFFADGRFSHAMGKAGSGPGELGQAAGPVFVGPDGVVAVPDIMQQRITLYGVDGQPEGSIPLPMTDGIPARWMKADNHDLVQQSMIMAMPGQMDVEPRSLILRRDPRGAIKDTLLIMPAGETMDFSGGQPRIRMFSPEPIWAIGQDDRLIHGNNAEYRFRVSTADGSLIQIVEKSTVRRPVTSGDQAEFRRIMRQMWERAGVPPQSMDMLAQSISFADFYPAYTTVFGGPHGTIWVQSVQTPETVMEAGGTFDIQDIGGPSWDIFGADGRLLGVLQTPARFNPLLFHDDQIYGVIRDDMDVQYVTRLQLVTPATAHREG